MTKFTIYLLLVFLCTLAVSESLSIRKNWTEFKEKHGKVYKDAQEEIKRRNIFLENLDKINEHNKQYELGLETWKMEMNFFGDLTREEINGYKGISPYYDHQIPFTHHVRSNSELPDSINWLEKGAVTNVKDQGSCESSWAFSATGALEGALFLKNGTLISLSEQDLVDCSGDIGNMGCRGGSPEYAFYHVMNEGIATEDEYPYTGKDGGCRETTEGQLLKDLKVVLLTKREDDLKNTVATVGPVSISMDASELSFYASGVYSGSHCDPTNVNHSALVVGYGTDPKFGDYWLVKNSWGTSWGESGYFKIVRGKGNTCGIVSYAAYPVIA